MRSSQISSLSQWTCNRRNLYTFGIYRRPQTEIITPIFSCLTQTVNTIAFLFTRLRLRFPIEIHKSCASPRRLQRFMRIILNKWWPAILKTRSMSTYFRTPNGLVKQRQPSPKQKSQPLLPISFNDVMEYHYHCLYNFPDRLL